MITIENNSAMPPVESVEDVEGCHGADYLGEGGDPGGVGGGERGPGRREDLRGVEGEDGEPAPATNQS